MKIHNTQVMACLAMLCVLFLAAAPTFGKDFWNIDCGGNSTFKASNGLVFEADDAYIATGVNVKAPSTAGNNISAEILTMRAFPRTQWKKNCYRIPVEQGTKVLVRTKFYYGNYDGKDSPPEFTVYYDTSQRCQVTADSFLTTRWTSCEVLYVTTKKQGTDICFIRTQLDLDPIVSAIEVSRLPSDMYSGVNFTASTLFMKRRFAFGANQTIEYPDDGYNRRWRPNSLQGVDGGDNNAVIVSRKSLAAPNTSKIPDDPPPLLFRAAVMALMIDNRTAGNLTIGTPWLSSEAFKIYLTIYYAEVELQSMNRTFRLFKDGTPLTGLILQAETEVAHELYGPTDASNETIFDLVPTKGSILPPIISGLEVFYIFEVNGGTDTQDVEAISILQSNFTVLQNWTGDPCHPKDYNWEWVTCNYTTSTFRITGLYVSRKLSGFQLSGNLPDFSGLDALTDIDLSNNTLTGQVPEFLASLPNLQVLDLSDNDFVSVPPSLANDKNITLILEGNKQLNRQSASSPGQEPTSPPSSGCRKLISFELAFLLLLLVIVTNA